MTHHPPIGGVPCATCKNFTPNENTPSVGMGSCAEGQGGWFARMVHLCDKHTAKGERNGD